MSKIVGFDVQWPLETLGTINESFGEGTCSINIGELIEHSITNANPEWTLIGYEDLGPVQIPHENRANPSQLLNIDGHPVPRYLKFEEPSTVSDILSLVRTFGSFNEAGEFTLYKDLSEAELQAIKEGLSETAPFAIMEEGIETKAGIPEFELDENGVRVDFYEFLQNDIINVDYAPAQTQALNTDVGKIANVLGKAGGVLSNEDSTAPQIQLVGEIAQDTTNRQLF